MSLRDKIKNIYAAHKQNFQRYVLIPGAGLILSAPMWLPLLTDSAAIQQQIAAAAVAGKADQVVEAMRQHPDAWPHAEISASKYLDALHAGQLLVVGLSDAANADTPARLLVASKAGELGYVKDSWRGSVTDKTLADRPADLTTVALRTPVDSGGSTGALVNLLLIGLVGTQLAVQFRRGSRFEPVQDVPTKFADVVGATEAKAALQDVVAFLKDPEHYAKLGAKPTRGILLSGPPGTGKTLLAKALAGECGVSFISCSGADFSSKFMGQGINQVKALFKQARKGPAAIIFIDEFDGLGRRSEGASTSSQESNRIINQFLVELDGFADTSKIIVVGATNHPDNIEPALRREGRFDRRITLRLPDLAEREKLLELYATPLTCAADVDYAQLARMTTGLAPAAVAAMCNLGAQLAARQGAAEVAMAHFAAALDTVHMGEATGALLTPADRNRTAIHEAGHAVVAQVLDVGTVEKVTILPRGDALGVTFLSPDESRRMQTAQELRNRVEMLLAGRAAEELVLGAPSTGAVSDLQRSTGILTEMVTNYGFGPGLATGDVSKPTDATLAHVRAELDTLYKQCKNRLAAHRGALDALTQALLSQETVPGSLVKTLVAPLKSLVPA